MSSLLSLVTATGPLRQGDDDEQQVQSLQLALNQAGYRVATDGIFGPRTAMVVQQFQVQHGLKGDGVVGPLTASMLDAPHAVLVQTATPMPLVNNWPHDDTASLLAFYGDPHMAEWEAENLVSIVTLFPIYYDGHPSKIRCHRKIADALKSAMDQIFVAGGNNLKSPILKHVQNYSGCYNLRSVRGSSRISTHGFGAAIDFDAGVLTLGKNVPASDMPQKVVDIFKKTGAFWGGDYIGRKDPMHFQYAHE